MAIRRAEEKRAQVRIQEIDLEKKQISQELDKMKDNQKDAWNRGRRQGNMCNKYKKVRVMKTTRETKAP